MWLFTRGHLQETLVERKHTVTGWWFGTCFIFPYIGNNHPNWLIFFRGVETTNQIRKMMFFPLNESRLRTPIHLVQFHLTSRLELHGISTISPPKSFLGRLLEQLICPWFRVSWAMRNFDSLGSPNIEEMPENSWKPQTHGDSCGKRTTKTCFVVVCFTYHFPIRMAIGSGCTAFPDTPCFSLWVSRKLYGSDWDRSNDSVPMDPNISKHHGHCLRRYG